jgi:transposase
MQVSTIGLDIAKNVFQVHGIDAAEKVVVRRQLRRGQVRGFFEALTPCLIGMEACASAHLVVKLAILAGLCLRFSAIA